MDCRKAQDMGLAMKTETYQIDLPYACFYLDVKDEIVTEAPPIARWCPGKKIGYVLDYFWDKGAKIKKIP
jgi:hypothetical protein